MSTQGPVPWDGHTLDLIRQLFLLLAAVVVSVVVCSAVVLYVCWIRMERSRRQGVLLSDADGIWRKAADGS
ncbi:hypothetical protein EHS25_002583 [Saitozyma podzolica]|uniref:Uncharacterized protein n=1 Tax=Saitozyma podzolica TaxID=1890683 RepID=A0A427YCM5_9TREE|nr:hypothetical protein EHS25_002583 [Saitozyma podzolica]